VYFSFYGVVTVFPSVTSTNKDNSFTNLDSSVDIMIRLGVGRPKNLDLIPGREEMCSCHPEREERLSGPHSLHSPIHLDA
jgi:hypothetical protein